MDEKTLFLSVAASLPHLPPRKKPTSKRSGARWMLGLCLLMAVSAWAWKATQRTPLPQIAEPPPAAPVQLPAEIVIDPGHGGRDPGTQGNGIIEKNGTLLISQALALELQQRGYRVLLTRVTDITSELSERAQISNQAPRRAFVSIHLNHGNGARARGIETFYSPLRSAEAQRGAAEEMEKLGIATPIELRSQVLAEKIHAGAVRATKAADRKVAPRPNLAVLNSTYCPSVLIECGFLSDTREATNLKSPAYHQILAQGIADGLEAYFNSEPIP